MNPGDTLIIEEPGTSLDSHLWIVISDPAENPEDVVLVNFTKYRADKDQACVVDRGDHPFISQRTSVEYRGAKTMSAKELQVLFDSGQISSHHPASPDLLARIRAGVPNSRMRNEHVLILAAQGVVDQTSAACDSVIGSWMNRSRAVQSASRLNPLGSLAPQSSSPTILLMAIPRVHEVEELLRKALSPDGKTEQA